MIELNRIREAAKKDKNLRFTSLMHHITIDLLREAYKALKRNAAPGIDEVTWRQIKSEADPLVISNALEDHLIPVYGDGMNARDCQQIS